MCIRDSTDTMSIYRTQEVMDGSLTRHERALVSENIPCRIYQSDNRTIKMCIRDRDYSPNQPRDKNGRWTSGGGNGKIGKTKYAPSPQRKHGGIQLKPKTYARLTGVLNTRFPNLPEGAIRQIRDAKHVYQIRADGYGGFELLSKRKI